MKKITPFVFPIMMVIFAIACVATMIMTCGCTHTPAEKMIISAVTPKATETVECVEWTTAATASPTSVTGVITSDDSNIAVTPTPTTTPDVIESTPTTAHSSETTHVVIQDEEYDIAYEEEDASYDGEWPIEEEPQPTSSQLVWYEKGTGNVVPIPEGTELDIIQQLDIAHGMIPFEY